MSSIHNDGSANRVVPETSIISDSLKVSEAPGSLKPDTFKSYRPPTSWQKAKELVGINVRVNVRKDGKVFPTSVNVSKVAKRNGIEIKGNESFIKEALRHANSADKTFDQIVRAENHSTFKKMAKDAAA